MLKDDYRRALIMMRGLRQGVSGYVRLERRTLIGTLQFTVNGAGESGELYALLLSAQNGLWSACKLDKLGPARYGQAGMVYRFDPRNLCGRDLGQYGLVAVAGLIGDTCELLLAGYLNGSMETDWAQVRQAVCQALVPQRASDPASAGDEPQAGTEAPPVPQIVVQPREGTPRQAPVETPAEISAETPSLQPDEFDRPAQAALSVEAPEPDEFDQPAQPKERETSPSTAAESAGEGMPQTAGQRLGLDMAVPWPDSIEPLRRLFQALPASEPFEAEGFVLVKQPVASATGLDHCVVGVSAAEGRPTRVLYAVPGAYAPEPPAGLEGYEWCQGAERGYWVLVRPVD